ncbi:glutathione S-transferase family protein [Rhodoligotrophos ferricapiens]|uniref:glutathione S-transferase family protein n=1 Tax=Rhodoligotrophos ferricapiens TaxID=3069264 RepID=UPI00315CA3E6
MTELTLYWSPGSCSQAVRVALAECEAQYEARRLFLNEGDQSKPEYLAINPRGRVPALQVDGAVITEVLAILVFIARRWPERVLLPREPIAEAQSLATMAWLSNTVHPGFARLFRPERVVSDPAVYPAVRDNARTLTWSNLQEIERALQHAPWMAGAAYSVCDPYTLVFLAWGKRLEFPLDELPACQDFITRMLDRPAVRKVLEEENSILLENRS